MRINVKYAVGNHDPFDYFSDLSQGRVSLEQRLGNALQMATLLILSLFSAIFQIQLA